MVFGALLTVFLLPANKVFRKDGSMVVKVKYSSPLLELKTIFALFKDWRMLCLVPMFFTSNWIYTYQWNAVNAFNFSTPRSRSMNSTFYWMAQIFASILYGRFLDHAQWSRPTRARYGLFLLTFILIGTWIGGIIFQTTFGPKSYIIDPKDGAVKNPADFHNIDLVENTK
ncbi:hypothetical protein BGZ49_006640, partial [Haplosporangium sp. Z 27]